MESQTTVTMVRLYLPEEGHSARRAQMEKVHHLLRDQLHVHGITVLAAITEPEDPHKPHYDTVGDILRMNPDPPAIIEFFYESDATLPLGRMLHDVVPDSHYVHWPVTWERVKATAA